MLHDLTRKRLEVAYAQNPPKVWLMMGHKAGDNSQVLALAEALGWPFEIKHFTYRRTELLTNLVCQGKPSQEAVRQGSPELIVRYSTAFFDRHLPTAC